ncbi:MAG: PspA/IM30 family protein [Ilumatobacteraceae bacterium]
MWRPVRRVAELTVLPAARLVRRPFGHLRRGHRDPVAELTTALDDAREHHRRLAAQARSVVASQKQAEIRLNGKLAELARMTANARRALVLADDAAAHDHDSADRYTRAAEAIAPQLVRLDADIESLAGLVIETTRAVDQAKAAMAEDADALREQIVRAARQVEQADQAAMATSISEVLAQLDATVGDDVPSTADVERRIKLRRTRARAAAEPGGRPVEAHDPEIDAAADDPVAAERLLALRDELGLSPGAAPDRRGG